MNEQNLIEFIKKEVSKYINLENNTKKDIEVIGEDLLLKDELQKNFKISDKSNHLIVTTIGIKEIVSLSQGTYNNDYCQKILESLLEGKKIFLIEEGIAWRSYCNIPLPLRILYENYEKELKKYGIQISKRLDIEERLIKKSEFISQGILDLKKIKYLFNSSKVIELSKNVKITELAKEFARENQIKLLKR